MKYSLKKEQLFDIRDLKFHNFMLKKKTSRLSGFIETAKAVYFYS